MRLGRCVAAPPVAKSGARGKHAAIPASQSGRPAFSHLGVLVMGQTQASKRPYVHSGSCRLGETCGLRSKLLGMHYPSKVRFQQQADHLVTMIRAIQRHLLGIAIALLCTSVITIGSVMAQGLTPLDKEALRYSQTNDSPAMSASVTVAAIARAPHYVEAIISEALKAAPSHREAIVHASIEAFPGHAAIVTRASEATTFLPTGRPRSPRGAEMQDQDVPRVVPRVAAKAPPTRRWSGEVSLGGAHSTGNTDTTSLNAALSATYTRGSLSSRSRLRFDLQEDGGSRSTQLFLTDNDTRYDIKSRLFVYNFIEYRDDRFSGFDYEVTENPGLGYRLIDRGLGVTP